MNNTNNMRKLKRAVFALRPFISSSRERTTRVERLVSYCNKSPVRNLASDVTNKQNEKDLDTIAVKNFQEYLRIPSVHPDVNYEPCVQFLTRLANELELPVKTALPMAKKPVVIITWAGTDTNLTSLMLNSHMDVVPVSAEAWTHPPFAAEEHNGRIYARGAQDMKCIGIQYLEAIRRLRKRSQRLKRTVHCVFVPDEEIGGATGMKLFVRTEDFARLNVGMSIDEGLPSTDEKFFVYYGERCMWHVTFHCPGQQGHGSLLLADTAAEKLNRLLTTILEHRATQTALLANDARLTIGDVMTVNVTMLAGGQQANVLPAELRLTMDCRIPVNTDLGAWAATLDTWCAAAGNGVHMTQARFEDAEPTPITDDNSYWRCFKRTVQDLYAKRAYIRRQGYATIAFLYRINKGLQIETRILPGGTDSRFVRQLGVPALGFSPINNHPVLLHDTDEYLETATFLRGIVIYERLIVALGDDVDRK